jgi:lysylphosphatidylglycerol synthetase-like protein (DUF2156 family)
MQVLTIVFGLLLMGVGIGGYVETGSAHPTALIPTWIGLVLAICGGLAMAPARRMLFMHIAVTVGLLGFLGTVKGAIDTFKLAHGATFEHPIAVEEKGVTCLLCLLFVAFCVRSFIAARRARELA